MGQRTRALHALPRYKDLKRKMYELERLLDHVRSHQMQVSEVTYSAVRRTVKVVFKDGTMEIDEHLSGDTHRLVEKLQQKYGCDVQIVEVPEQDS